jgi:hypothetical protein
VDHAGPVHHGSAAMAGLGSSLELDLLSLRGSRLPGKGWGRKREARGPDSGLTGAWKVAEWWRNGSEGSGGEALGVGSLRAGREVKVGWARSRGRRGRRGALLLGQRGSGAARHRRGTAPVVVHHNGVEGGHFQSGISRGVMGGGEHALAIMEAEGEGRREAAAHARANGGGGAIPEWLEEEDE